MQDNKISDKDMEKVSGGATQFTTWYCPTCEKPVLNPDKNGKCPDCHGVLYNTQTR